MSRRTSLFAWFLAAAVWGVPARGQQPSEKPAAPLSTAPSAGPGDSVSIRIVNTEMRAAMQVIAPYLDRPIIVAGPAGPSLTVETPRPIPRADVPRLLRSLLDSQNYELVDDTAGHVFRVRPKEAPKGSAPGAPQASAAMAHLQGAPELFVIPLKHAKASDVAATINALFGRGVSDRSARPDNNRPAGTIADELRANQIPMIGASVMPEAIPGTAGRPAMLSGDLAIVPDSRTNSLLIRANRNDFTLIEAAVEQVDVRPLQVLIEVMIVETQNNYNFNFGIDAAVADQSIKHTPKTTVGGSTTSGLGTGIGGLTLQLMGATGINVDATITAAADRGEVHILSRPTVLAANNEKAEVIVGSQRPFVQMARTEPTDAGIQDQIVEYKDVGTKLTVTPTISVDGSVQLAIIQEVSNATTETQFNAPVISNRSVSTELLVRDGQTIVLGGLRDREHDTDTGGVPLLSSIPLLGGLFGHSTRTATETELYLFMTPHVIRTDDDAKSLTEQLQKRAEQQKP